MTKFLKGSILFFITIFIIVLTLLLILKSISLKYSDYKLNNDIKTIIIGDSQTECAFNDEDVNNMINLSQSADNHLYSYAKLKILLDKNPSIKRVVLGYSYTNTIEYYNKYYSESQYINYKIPKYFNILDWSLLAKLFTINIEATISTIPIIIKNSAKLTMRGDLNIRNQDIGGFVSLPVRSEIIKIKKINSKEFSLIQREYLLKINELCHSEGVKLILLSTPIYKAKATFSDEIVRLTEQLPKELNIDYINLVDCNIDVTNFYDGVHLNSRGAKAFTNILIDSLSRIK